MKPTLWIAASFFFASFVLSSCIGRQIEDTAQKTAVAAFDKAHPPALSKDVAVSPAAPVASGLDQVDAGLDEAQDDVSDTSTALDANDVPAAKVSNTKAAGAISGVHVKVKSLIPGAKSNEKKIETEQEYPILRNILLAAFWFECAGVAIFAALALLQSITFIAAIANFIDLGASTLLEIAGWLFLAAIGAMYGYYHVVVIVHAALIIGLVICIVLAIRWALHNKAKVKALEDDAHAATVEFSPAISFVDQELIKAGHWVGHLGLNVLQKLHILNTTSPIAPNVQTPAAPLPQANPQTLG